MYQQLMTDIVKAADVVLGQHRYETSHSPFLIKTEEVVQLVQQVSTRPTTGASLISSQRIVSMKANDVD